ncbi:hypothetical protein SAMN04488005_1218 [Yoonia tamlensis]|uniref:Uncharacterized protein n=1 Tax=Yoonia tamlensis TaxID=390270 RepID=A0A1I6G811_9RHOB|nr:hypothetical protein [Yoonia tamlensis]SFR38325.1 hypothetical protein SAMN04488005_1218 [Yoonia tamlensis]
MPRTTFAIILISVIALAALTVWAISGAGELAPLGILALLALTIALRFWGKKQ